MSPITGLYLVPVDGSTLLDPDACGGRPPMVHRPTLVYLTGEPLVPQDWSAGGDEEDMPVGYVSHYLGGDGRRWRVVAWEHALAIVHRGELLPLGVARAGEYLRTDALSCAVEAMLTLSEGEGHHWRVVVVRGGE